MKRFITYLYEYERESKTKNAGFIRVDERNGIVNMQVCVRNFIRSNEKGKIYAYIWDSGLIGLSIGEVGIMGGQGDVRLQFATDGIADSRYRMEDVIGIGIRFQNNGYLASCWNDERMEAVGKGRFRDFREKEVVGEVSEIQVAEDVESPQVLEVPVLAEEARSEPEFELETTAAYDLVTYQKMELNAIRNLPSPNWYLCNNRFLVHGFFNYGCIVLKKTIDTDGEKAYLGVPGVFEKPEMVMAALFGFPEFQALPQEVQTAKMEEIVTLPSTAFKTEKNQEPKSGTLGCWFIPLEV